MGHHLDHPIPPPQGDITLPPQGDSTLTTPHHKGTSPRSPHPTRRHHTTTTRGRRPDHPIPPPEGDITSPPQREITVPPQGDIIPTITPTLTAPFPVLQFPVPACHLLLTDANLLLSFLSLLQFPLSIVHFHQLLKLSDEEEEKSARLAKL